MAKRAPKLSPQERERVRKAAERNTQASYTVISVVPMRGEQLGEVEGETFNTIEKAVAEAKTSDGDVMVRENRIVWLSPALEVRLLERKVKRDIAARGKPQEDRV